MAETLLLCRHGHRQCVYKITQTEQKIVIINEVMYDCLNEKVNSLFHLKISCWLNIIFVVPARITFNATNTGKPKDHPGPPLISSKCKFKLEFRNEGAL